MAKFAAYERFND